MNGKDLFSGLSYISKKYIDEAENDMISSKTGKFEASKHGKTLFHKSLLIAAAIATMLFLMGAAVYTHWSDSMQRYYQPSENAKQQAEKSGLSVMYQEESKHEDGSIMTATDQGITVSVVQTIVDQSRAKIILRVEGFTPSVDYKVEPWVWTEEHATLDGNDLFYSSANYDFDDGVTRSKDGEYVYADGSPVDMIVEGEYNQQFIKGQYIKHDGSLELVISYVFQDTSGANLGKELALHITGFGTCTYIGKANDEFEKLVEGHWDLRFPLTGSDENIQIEPNVRLSDNVTLTKAEIGQITVKTWYKTDTYWDGWERLESLTPILAGVKLKDGTFVQVWGFTEGYLDQEELIYYSECQVFEGMLELDQVESLAYYDGWEKDAEGKPTIPVYKYIPVTP